MPNYYDLYHYTTAEVFRKITTKPEWLVEHIVRWVVGRPDPELLKPSLGEGGKDAFHGPGWYFTDIAPGTMSRRDIAIRLWDGGGFHMDQKTECFLQYSIHHRAVIPCKKHVYLIRAQSKAQLTLISSGRTPNF